MSGEASERSDAGELRRLGDLAAGVLAETEIWIAAGVGHDVVLALVQNALPLIADARDLSGPQRRSHAQVLTALLLLLDDPAAGDLATDLAETLRRTPPTESVLAS